ncbi:hypothetical protein HPB51_021004 [Rhipicephalus microplus]|uniref:Uncharacterized protein n=1 Tax=Rhipicephalus microplus TaxID=6941 RepID=A0A9J6DCG8_RHIMP|nr:hypothetical protein HPB51_021004 [Rhipicephalus microplus]
MHKRQERDETSTDFQLKLFLPLLHDQHVVHKKTRWREYTGRIDHVVDYLWQGELRRLRSQFSTTRRGSTGVVHTYGDIALPDFVMKTLGLGPKFAVEKRRTPTELLATVRQVANCAPPEDTDRCVSEGLDVLLRDFVMKTLGLGPKFAVEKRRTPTELLATVRQVANCAPPEDTDRCVSEGLDVLLRESEDFAETEARERTRIPKRVYSPASSDYENEAESPIKEKTKNKTTSGAEARLLQLLKSKKENMKRQAKNQDGPHSKKHHKEAMDSGRLQGAHETIDNLEEQVEKKSTIIRQLRKQNEEKDREMAQLRRLNMELQDKVISALEDMKDCYRARLEHQGVPAGVLPLAVKQMNHFIVEKLSDIEKLAKRAKDNQGVAEV